MKLFLTISLTKIWINTEHTFIIWKQFKKYVPIFCELNLLSVYNLFRGGSSCTSGRISSWKGLPREVVQSLGTECFGLADKVVISQRLDLMIQEVYSILNDSVLLWNNLSINYLNYV